MDQSSISRGRVIVYQHKPGKKKIKRKATAGGTDLLPYTPDSWPKVYRHAKATPLRKGDRTNTQRLARPKDFTGGPGGQVDLGCPGGETG